MSITAKFRVNKDRVSLEIPEKNLLVDKSNVIFFDSQKNEILGIGVPEEIIRSDILKREAKEVSSHLIFGKSFQHDDEKSGFFDLAVIQYDLADLYFAKQILPIPIESVDFDFQIDEYEKWDEQRKLWFEFSLQAQQKGRSLKINGVSRDAPIAKRKIEKILRLFLLIFFPLGILYYGFTKSNSMLGLLFAFIGFFASILVDVIIWALTSKFLLPKTYLAFILPALPFHSWTQKIAERILDIHWQA